MEEESAYVELPALDVLPCVFICNDDDELGDLSANHPLVELRHDLLDVSLYLVIGRDLTVLAVPLGDIAQHSGIYRAC